MSEQDEAGSPPLSFSGFSSLFSISGSTTAYAAAHPHHQLHLRGPALSLSIGGGAEQVGTSCCGDGDDVERKTVRMMKNRESALRSRARKRAYVQELEKEVRRLVDENLKLKRHCKQLKTEMTALIQPTKSKSSSHRRTSSTQF